MSGKTKVTTQYEVTEEQLQSYREIEDLVAAYQKQFQEEYIDDEEVKKQAEQAAADLLERFTPLFTKYALIIRSGHFNWSDHESRVFVSTFMTDKTLTKAIFYSKLSNLQRSQIYNAFNFIKEIYGKLPQEDILTDMQMCLLVMAKKYKCVGKNFCAYISSVYRYELSRHIKKVSKNPLNAKYNVVEYDNNSLAECQSDLSIDDTIERYRDQETGRPSIDWFKGDCGKAFSTLTEMERKIIVKYYMDHWKDAQIADAFGLHLNTINYKRRNALKKIYEATGRDFSELKRSRNSGRGTNYTE